MHKRPWIGAISLFSLLIPITPFHNLYDENAWLRAGEYLKDYMDNTKKPCGEFYNHVCGKFNIETDGNRSAPMTYWLVDKMKDLTSTELSADPFERVIQTLLLPCMESQGDADMAQNLDQAVNETIKKILYGSTDDQSVDDGNTTDPYGDGGTIQSRDQGSNIVESRDGGSSNEHAEEVLKYFLHIPKEDLEYPLHVRKAPTEKPWLKLGRMVRELGLIGGSAIGFSVSVMTKENIAALLLKPLQETVPDSWVVEDLTIDQLPALIPSIDWQAYFDGFFGGEFKNIARQQGHKIRALVYSKKNMEAVGKSINAMDPDTLNAEITELVHQRIIQNLGHLTTPTCPGTILKRRVPALVRLYFQSIDANLTELRHDIITMQRNIFSAFRFLLNSADWLDAGDKEKVQRKIDHITFYPGIPAWIDNDTKVMENMLRYTYNSQLNRIQNEMVWWKRDHEGKLLRIIHQTEEDEIMLEKNAEYEPTENRIHLWLGSLVPPMYGINYPLAVKYGALGSTLGHELLHAFDANLVKTPYSKHEEWISGAVWEQFDRRVDCLIRHYSKQCLKDKGYCVSGRRNIGENMADVDGLKTAYVAFKFATQVFGEDPPIPTMLNYTQNQLFFLAAARKKCSSGWREVFRTDPHTPNKIRVDVQMQNVPLFARAYGCKVGSKYAPMKVCSVWGDLANPARKRRSTIG